MSRVTKKSTTAAGQSQPIELESHPVNAKSPLDFSQARESKQNRKQAVLVRLHQLTLSRVPLRHIAREFAVSVRTVIRWRRELKERFREEALLIDPLPMFGQTLAHYRQITAAGWQLYLGARDASGKLRGLEMALN